MNLFEELQCVFESKEAGSKQIKLVKEKAGTLLTTSENILCDRKCNVKIRLLHWRQLLLRELENICNSMERLLSVHSGECSNGKRLSLLQGLLYHYMTWVQMDIILLRTLCNH